MPKGALDRVDTGDPLLVRILLDPSDPLITEGGYRFTFPVLMPESALLLPRNNIWYLCLCVDKNCASPQDQETHVAFALAGFGPGEVSALEEKRKAAALGKKVASDARPVAMGPQALGWIVAWLLLGLQLGWIDVIEKS